jgi:hypothetical protein
MCEVKRCELSRRRNTIGPATHTDPRQGGSSKLPPMSGGLDANNAHALPGRCLPVMFLVSTMSET